MKLVGLSNVYYLVLHKYMPTKLS